MQAAAAATIPIPSHTLLIKVVLVDEAAILYKKMVKDFTNQAIIDVAADSSTNVLPSMIYLDEQTDHIQASLAYRHITQTSVYE
jgi:hypothetical protein